MRAVLAEHDALFDHTVHQVSRRDFLEFDWILGMDRKNLRELTRLAPSNARAALALVSEPWGGGEVTDPYYQGDWACEQTYLELSDLTDRWLKRWLEET